MIAWRSREMASRALASLYPRLALSRLARKAAVPPSSSVGAGGAAGAAGAGEMVSSNAATSRSGSTVSGRRAEQARVTA